MKRHVQNRLFHLLPVVFWLLAIGGSIVPFILHFSTDYLYGFLVAGIVLLCTWMLTRIKRHGSSLEECFIVSILLGIASYWLMTVIFLAVLAGLYLHSRNLLEWRGVMAMIVGFALVAIWAAVLDQTNLLPYSLSLTDHIDRWIPTGAVIFAWTAATIARRSLHVR